MKKSDEPSPETGFWIEVPELERSKLGPYSSKLKRLGPYSYQREAEAELNCRGIDKSLAKITSEGPPPSTLLIEIVYLATFLKDYCIEELLNDLLIEAKEFLDDTERDRAEAAIYDWIDPNEETYDDYLIKLKSERLRQKLKARQERKNVLHTPKPRT